MHQGRIVLDGPPRQVFRRSRELLSLDLDLPDAVRIADALRSRGWPIRPDAMTLKEVEAEIRTKGYGGPSSEGAT
jgi:hypothetical protein